MNDDTVFHWLSPSAVVHGGRFFRMETLCGTRVPPIGTGWAAHQGPSTCLKCVQIEAPRPTAVSIDRDGNRTIGDAGLQPGDCARKGVET